MIDVTFIEGDTRQKLQRLGAAVGLSVRDMAHEQMRLSCTSAIKWTFPHKKSDGAHAVERDIRNVFGFKDTFVDNWAGNRVPAGHVAVKESGGDVYLVTSENWGTSMTPSDMRKLHESRRNPRTGKTKFSRGPTLGKWNVSSKAYPKKSQLRSYIKERKAKVGQLKAGWMPAANYYAAKARGNVVAPPWVKSQEKQIGTYQDTMGKSGNGTMTASNTVPYWSTPKRTEIENLVHSIAQKRIDRTTQGQINKLAERFNAGRI